METFIKIISILGIGLLTMLVYFLKDLPRLYRSLKIEKVKAEHSMELQREAYFRQISGNELSKLFKDWTAMLYDIDRKLKGFGERQAIDLLSRTVIYGSTKTVSICSEYFKFIYKTDSSQDNEENLSEGNLSYDGCMQILFVAYIVSSLKFDFTGYYIEPMKLLHIKINDLDKTMKSEEFQRAFVNIKKIVKEIEN
ncbi:MAG: hypothetical protein PUK21_01465 [Peptostreptococcaceae bacterium]|nr:hypothetical protein [Peptostreptococcaceae bacterium]MDY5738677.1 hypothetical protein [Anaerovoracaceae bacterium]